MPAPLDQTLHEILRWLERELRNHADAEDLAQEIRIGYWARQRGNHPSPADPNAYLWTMARNAIMSYQRKKKRRPNLLPLSEVMGDASRQEESIEANRMLSQGGNGRLTKNPVELAETLGMIVTFIDTLPPRYRIVARMAFIDEAPIRAVAEKLTLSTDAVKKRIERSRRLLQPRLTSFYTN